MSPRTGTQSTKTSRRLLAAGRFIEISDTLQSVLATTGEEIREAPWYSEDWLDDMARAVVQRFDGAFARWRELYKAATEQRDAARKIIDNPRAARPDRERADQREREARREIQLLLNEGGMSETDFYVYAIWVTKAFFLATTSPGCQSAPLSQQAMKRTRSTERDSSVWSSLVPATFSITKDASIASIRSSCLLEALRLASLELSSATIAATFIHGTTQVSIFASIAVRASTERPRSSRRLSSNSRPCGRVVGPALPPRRRSGLAKAI